ncbi:MAG: flagellar motor switch protein FliN [Proteobacteria bacterium]|nr:flagellar motor switch protein FliN [Pseudomonadota bacterium]
MIEASESGGAPSSIDLLRDVPLEVQAQLGKSRKLVKDILKLNVGSIIELDKEAGEPVDILVNNKLIARGDVVEIDGNYGVRIIEIVSR